MTLQTLKKNPRLYTFMIKKCNPKTDKYEYISLDKRFCDGMAVFDGEDLLKIMSDLVASEEDFMMECFSNPRVILVDAGKGPQMMIEY